MISFSLAPFSHRVSNGFICCCTQHCVARWRGLPDAGLLSVALLRRAWTLRGYGASWLRRLRLLSPDHFHQLLHRIGALLKCGLFFRHELDLDDLFQAAGAELAGHADEQAVNAVFAFEIGGAGQDFLLVFENRFDHLGRSRGRGVVGAAGLEILHNFGAAVAGALHQAIYRGLVHEFRNGNPSYRGVAGQGHHSIAVAAEDERGHVLHADFQFFGNEGAEARGVEHAGHADYALALELTDLERRLRHRVERIGDHDQDAVGRVRDHFADHVLHDLVVSVEQIVAAHARLPRNAGGDDHDVRVGGIGVIVGAENVRVPLFDRHRFQEIEAFALGHAFDDVDENNVRELFRGDPVRGRRSNIARAYD